MKITVVTEIKQVFGWYECANLLTFVILQWYDVTPNHYVYKNVFWATEFVIF